MLTVASSIGCPDKRTKILAEAGMIAARGAHCHKPFCLQAQRAPVLLHHRQRTTFKGVNRPIPQPCAPANVSAGNRMLSTYQTTRCVNVSRSRALLIVSATAASMVWCLLAAFSEGGAQTTFTSVANLTAGAGHGAPQGDG